MVREAWGIITKPDKIEPASNLEELFITLAKNKDDKFKFKLGWHTLRNASFNERKRLHFDRDEIEEAFFAKTSRWRSLDESQRGVSALRLRLRDVLQDHIKAILPKILSRIDNEVERCTEKLERLGEPRETEADQRIYLTEKSEKLSQLIVNSVNGTVGESVLEQPNLKLRTMIVKARKNFAHSLVQGGHRWAIVDDRSKQQKEYPFTTAFNFDRDTPSRCTSPTSSTFPDLKPINIRRSDYLKLVQNMLNENPGRGLPGTFEPLLIGKLFRDKAKRWEGIARRYAEATMDMVRKVLEDLVLHVFGDELGRRVLKQVIDQKLEQRELELNIKVAELLAPYQGNNIEPVTCNPYYDQLLQDEKHSSIPTASTDQSFGELYACASMLDAMEAYYNIATATFFG